MPPRLRHPDARCCPAGDSEQPASHGILLANRTRLTGQHEKSRLEGILGRVPILERLIAHADDHRTMPLDQGSERGLTGLAFIV